MTFKHVSLAAILIGILTWSLSGCLSRSSDTTLQIGDFPFVLASVYEEKEGEITNLYNLDETTSPDDTFGTLHIKQIPAKDYFSFDQISKAFDELLISLGRGNGLIRQSQKGTYPFISLAFLQDRVYTLEYILFQGEDIIKMSLNIAVPKTATFEEMDKLFFPAVHKLKKPIQVYAVRPGQTAADESETLSKLKKLLDSSSAQSNTQVVKQGKITYVDTVNTTQREIFQLIAYSPAADVTAWLKQHIADYDPIYLYAFAIRMSQIEKAPVRDIFFWLTAAKMRSRADRTLCKDKYVGQYIVLLSSDSLQAAISEQQEAELSRLLSDQTQFIQLLKEVAAWDAQHPQKNSPVWLCNSGHQGTTSEMVPASEWNQRRNEFKKQYTASLYK